MSRYKRALAGSIGKWSMVHTKAGAYLGRIEGIHRRGITVLVPGHYAAQGPIKVLKKNISLKASETAGVPYPYGRLASGPFVQWFIPFWFLLPFLLIPFI